jgi:hypothetical protein
LIFLKKYFIIYLVIKKEKKMKKIAITGHRPPRLLGQEEMIKKWGREQLLQLQPSVMYNGMAEGTDKLFALLAK